MYLDSSTNRHRHSMLLLLLTLMLLLYSCANRGVGPQGGPKDTIPPLVVMEKPLNGMINYHGKKIEIAFNEYIQLDNVVENVVISPPQQVPPIIKAVGKKVVLSFEEELKDSTTYTIDFGRAICDYNERIPIENYSFSFCTGMERDSMAVFGYVVNAADLNPISGIIVGIHSNHEDSAFSTIPFDRIGKSNKDGEFSIQNIHAGDYRLYALHDVSRDYLYQPGEGLAYSDSLLIPYMESEVHTDTLWIEGKDSTEARTIDTIRTHQHTMYGPADLILWYFEEDKTRHYFQRGLREDRHMLRLLFASAQDSLPTLRSLRPSDVDSLRHDSLDADWVDWMPYTRWRSSQNRDTLTCWLTDSLAIRQDTLYLEMTYMKSDSLYNLVPQTDTLNLIYRAPRMTAKAREAKEKKSKERKLTIKSNSKSNFEVFDTLRLTAEYPIDTLYLDSIHLYQKIDTTYHPMAFNMQPTDSSRLQFDVFFASEPAAMYELRIDSAAMCDIYGVWNVKSKIQLKLKSIEEYATLRIMLTHFNPQARIQLLDEKETVVREAAAEPEGTLFQHLAPKAYYVRLYIDANGDGKWTTGDWLKKRQPEAVYYYPHKLNLRANWDFEEHFDHLAIPQLDGKPQELIKDANQKK